MENKRRKDLSKSDFGNMREVAIQRDGSKCTNCNMSRKQHIEKYGRDITVHHIDGNGRKNSATTKNNNLDNLKTLCLSCHGREDRLRAKPASEEKIKQSKITEEDAIDIRLFAKLGFTQKQISKVYPITVNTISSIIRLKTWRNLKKKERVAS